ncbi:hypothetical protein Pla123a_02200 [Posidoniimonas polymericola]|uniref:Flagellar protein FliL n=1 Tax=Posidoniimonas polymericola TaxID=2528002 RepID=A0A5C5ZFR8_9BACT|nr:hypothetical protein [Posidoniimonas polymericola]TWT85413.1 hypothetical protein Pla123a_02200 [Posidoniimonas polymericola]
MKPVFATAVCLALCLPQPAARGADKEPPEEPAMVGFELGSFVLKDYQPIEDITLRLIFTVHASVTEENAAEFSRTLASRAHRVRDQVITAARLASLEELQDPELQMLRRRIQLRLKHSLPELHIDNIHLSEFQLYRD